MKLILRSLTALALIALVTVSAQAQSSSSATAGADAKVVAGISLTKVNDLKFGEIIRSATAGSVSLDASTGNRSASGGVTLGLAAGAQAAEFSISGEPAYNFNVTLPTSISISHATSASTMTVDNFASTLTAGGGTLDAAGSASFSVGADLGVAANQETGVYSGDFTVTAAYN